MGEIKHTYGKWEVYSVDGRYGVRGEVSVIVPACSLDGEGINGIYLDEDEANARLFAAAPEMKEALEEALMALSVAEAEARRYAGFYEQGSDGRNTFLMLADSIADRRSKLSGPAALAKANGEAA